MLLSVFETDRFIELVFRGERACLRTGGGGGELRVKWVSDDVDCH